MGSVALGVARVATDDAVPAWDRFAHWPRFPARLALFAFLLLLLASALVPITAGPGVNAASAPAVAGQRERDHDLALYDRVIERVGNGEGYYQAVVDEHRLSNYPLRPGFAVRLPTLAYLDAWLGRDGQVAAAIALVLATLVAWWRRLGKEPGGAPWRWAKLFVLYLGVSIGLTSHFFVLHELWTGTLLALAFGLHRPGRWSAALAVAAVALAIREHALPFVLLMGATAFWRRDWKEGAAWTGLAAAFLAMLGVHLQLVSAHTLPTDSASPGWLELRGLSGWLSNIVLASNLRFLPHCLAGPLVIVMTLGWAGWRSPAGTFGTLLFLGYALAFAIAGRPENYYWGFVIAPTMVLGFAFAPRAIVSLCRSAGRAARI